MKISGVAIMHGPPGLVWAALNDPAVLVATIPGCERLEPTGPDSYRFTVAAGVASIHGIYTGEVSLSQRQAPSSFVLTAAGAGGPGTVSTTVQVRLADVADGSTELSYDADAVIGGMIAGVGQRMLSSVAKRMAAQFFVSVDKVLTDKGLVVSQPAAAGPDAVPASIAPALTAPALTAPALTAPALTAPVPAAPQPSAYLAPARPPAAARIAAGFVPGVLVGAAVALAGVAVGALIGRRAR
jgi:uncharacterized protein